MHHRTVLHLLDLVDRIDRTPPCAPTEPSTRTAPDGIVPTYQALISKRIPAGRAVLTATQAGNSW